jgi:hypothetical protein
MDGTVAPLTFSLTGRRRLCMTATQSLELLFFERTTTTQLLAATAAAAVPVLVFFRVLKKEKNT